MLRRLLFATLAAASATAGLGAQDASLRDARASPPPGKPTVVASEIGSDSLKRSGTDGVSQDPADASMNSSDSFKAAPASPVKAKEAAARKRPVSDE